MAETMSSDPSGNPGYLAEGAAIAPGRGASWWAEGWATFVRAPLLWAAMVLVIALACILISFIPVLGSLAVQLLLPIVAAGLLEGCRDLERGAGLEPARLAAAIRRRFGPLLVLSALYLGATVAISLVAGFVGFGAVGVGGFGAMMNAPDAGSWPMMAGGMMGGMGLAILLALGLSVPVAMAYWFSPALVLFHDVAPVTAAKASFRASLKNIGPFSVFGLIGLVLFLAASIPFGAGWLLVGPMMIGAQYASYREVFRPQR